MDFPTLTHQECIAVVARPERDRTVVLTITSHPPLTLVCVVRTAGDIIVPTGTDPWLERMAHGKPVTVEFPGEPCYAITGVGLACPLRHEDRLVAKAALPERRTFDHGIRVLVARLTGRRLSRVPSATPASNGSGVVGDGGPAGGLPKIAS